MQGPLFARVATAEESAQLLAYMDAVNSALEGEGADYRAGYAEYITPSGGSEVGATILQQNLGNKHLNADFVAFDPRRSP